MKRILLLIAAFPALSAVVVVVVALMALGGISAHATSCAASGTVMAAPIDVNLKPGVIYIAGLPMSAEQTADAETVIGVAEARGLDHRDTLTVLMIGLQETKLTNPPSGSGDSLGIFQQSPSNGWGTPQQIMDVIYATNRLIDRLQQIDGRESMSLLDVALAVQNPNKAAYLSPQNYFPGWELTAEQILSSADPPADSVLPANPKYTTSCAVAGPADGRVETAVQYALSVMGTPYVWGGESETNGFDCSGLVWWAFSAAGFPFGRTTAAGEYGWGQPVGIGQLQRGDLVFWAYDPEDPSTIHHVAIYIGGGRIVAAPHTGDVVKVEPVYDTPHMMAVRLTQVPEGK
jgi:cell wall-associated NlpC family hydrolase